jgi:hypothetical protein
VTRRSRPLFVLLLVLAVTVAVFLGKVLDPEAALYTRFLGDPELLWLGALAEVAFLGIAFAFAAWNAREFEPGNPSRRAWRLLAAGLLGFLPGRATLSIYQIAGVTDPSPSVADAFLMIGYPLLIAALVQFLRAYAATGLPIGSRAGRWALGLGSAAILGLLGYSILIPIVWTPGPLLKKFLNVAYPVFDWVLLVLTLVLLRISVRFRGGAVWKVWIFLLSGFFLLSVADIFRAFLSGLGEIHLLNAAVALSTLSFGCIAGGVLAERELLLP